MIKFIHNKNIQFDHILESIQQWLGRFGDRTSSNPSTVVGQIIQAVSAVISNLFIYIEDSLTEQNKYTAKRKKSIYGLAALSGYEPHLGSAARSTIRLYNKPHNSPTTNIYIPNETVISSSTGQLYTILLDTTATSVGTGEHVADTHFNIIQGRYETQRFASEGEPHFSVNIKYMGYIDIDFLSVTVNGVKWHRVSSLYDLDFMEEGFYIRTNIVDGVDVVFGNGTHGAIPTRESSIEVRYILHDGESGNISNPNEKFLFYNLLLDDAGDEVDGNLLFDLVADSGSQAAGTDAESEIQVREMIGYNSRSLVLAEPSNFNLFLNRFSFVGYNKTWSDPGSMVIRSLVMKNFQSLLDRKSYYELVESDFILSDQQKESIINTIYNSGRLLAGSTYQLEDIELWKYCVYIYIKPSRQVDKKVVEKKIRDLLAELFTNIGDDKFVPKSDLTKIIQDGCPEVDGVNIYFLSQRNEDAIRNGEYVSTEHLWDNRTGTYRIAKHTTKVYAGENPSLGLDAHGNIVVDNNRAFPILSGGWRWRNNKGQEITTQPVNIVWE